MRFTGPQKYELYTVDVNLSSVKLEPEVKYSALRIKIRRILQRFQNIKFKNSATAGHISIVELFTTDEDVAGMRKGHNPRFVEEYEEGVKCYEQGFWEEAKFHFENAERIKKSKDHPCQKLIEVMEHYKFEAPFDWDGARNFEEVH